MIILNKTNVCSNSNILIRHVNHSLKCTDFDFYKISLTICRSALMADWASGEGVLASKICCKPFKR